MQQTEIGSKVDPEERASEGGNRTIVHEAEAGELGRSGGGDAHNTVEALALPLGEQWLPRSAGAAGSGRGGPA